MAKLPQALNVVGGVSPQQLPGVRVPAGAFGEDIGKAARELGAVVQQEADKQFDLDNKAEAQELSNELNTRMRALEIGDGDQEPGYRSALGKAAMDKRGSYEQRAEDLRKELMGRASNDTVRRTFGAVAANRTGRFYDTVGAHFNAQRLAFRETAMNNTNNVATDNAVNATTDEERVAHADDAHQNTWNYYTKQRGLPDAIAKTYADDARSAVHKAVILGLVDDEPSAAREYYKKIERQIDGGDKPALEKALRGGYVKEQSRIEAMKIANTRDQGTGEPLSLTEQMARAKRIKDVDVSDAAIARLKADHQIRETERKIEIRALRQEAYEMIENGVDRNGEPVDPIKSFSDLPTALKAALPGNDAAQLIRYIASKNDRGSGFAIGASDPTTEADLYEKSIAEDKSDFIDVDLNSLRSKLTREDYRRFITLQRGFVKERKSESYKNPSYALADRLTKEAVAAAGIKIGPKKTANNKRFSIVVRNTRALVDEAREAGRPPPSREDIMKQLARDLLKIDEPGWEAKNKYRFEAEMSPGYQIADYEDADVQAQIATATGIPVAEVAKIIRDLDLESRSGTNTGITLDGITQIYQIKLEQNEMGF